MHHLISNLILYSDLGRDGGILAQLGEVYRDLENDGGFFDRASMIQRIYWQIKHLLDISTQYGFDENLWQNYLTFLLLTCENSFTLTAERAGMEEGSVTHFAKQDFTIFRELFHYDFRPIERQFGLDCFTTITNYKALKKKEKSYYRAVSDQVRSLSRKLAAARDTDEFYVLVTDFYRRRGVGMFGLNRAFRIRSEGGDVAFLPINNTDKILLTDLIGYEEQKNALIENTDAFVRKLPANNVLLYGDAGTGKSSCIKALLNEYYDAGLRMIEIYKHQFRDLSSVIAAVKNRNYRFIIYMDDLSFEEDEVEYKFLKAVIEGGLESRPDNVLLYATSNRRHLIKETWADRNDMEFSGEIHRSDTVEEKLSLAARFGVAVNFNAPTRQQYHEIVMVLAARQLGDARPKEDELLKLADRWELRHGGLSGRTAQQFVNYLAGQAGID